MHFELVWSLRLYFWSIDSLFIFFGGASLNLITMVSKGCLALYFLFLMSTIICAKDQLVVWRREGKELVTGTNDPTHTVSINQVDECIGKCSDISWCKSFHVYKGGKLCDLFSVDRCSLNVKLEDVPGFSYFDMIPKECPPGKWSTSFFHVWSNLCCHENYLSVKGG